MGKGVRLTELQIAIMQALWRLGEATVAEVQAALAEKQSYAPTTIATMLSRLEKKNLVDHIPYKRQFVYRPLVSEAEVCRSMVGELTDHLFRGSVADLFHHLLRESDITPGDIARVKRLIREKEQGVKGHEQ